MGRGGVRSWILRSACVTLNLTLLKNDPEGFSTLRIDPDTILKPDFDQNAVEN